MFGQYRLLRTGEMSKIQCMNFQYMYIALNMTLNPKRTIRLSTDRLICCTTLKVDP